MDKGQEGAFSKDEVARIIQFTNSRPDALLILRNHFLQLGVHDEEKIYLKELADDVMALIGRFMLPTLSNQVPLPIYESQYARLDFIGQYSTEGALLHIKVNDLIIDYIEQQFEAIKTDTEPHIVLAELPDGPKGVDQGEQRVINTLAYNKVVSLIVERLHKMSLVRPLLEPDKEEEKKKNQKNSTR